jgi:hypothetical protein
VGAEANEGRHCELNEATGSLISVHPDPSVPRVVDFFARESFPHLLTQLGGSVFLRRGKSTDGWAMVGFGIFACIFSLIGLSGGSGAVESVNRLGLMILFGIPLGIAAIIGGIVALYRDGRRAQD